MSDGFGVFAPVGTDGPWEDPPRLPPSSAAPVLAVAGFEGPLDWLLELVRAERIDLRKMSILALVEAFGAALQLALASPARPDLSRWGEFLSMAAQLTLLRSRLLLPPHAAAAKAAHEQAEALRRVVLEGDTMRRSAAWLDRRQQLGREVFGRGVLAAERSASARGADIADLLRACLVVLRVADQAEFYAVSRPPLWRMQDAMARITRLLAEREAGGTLGTFLPKLEHAGPEHELRCRAALASTLLAGLELAREGTLQLEQNAAWQTIEVREAAA